MSLPTNSWPISSLAYAEAAEAADGLMNSLATFQCCQLSCDLFSSPPACLKAISGGAGPGWGLVRMIACWAPPFPLIPKQASLLGSGIPLNTSLEGHSLWDLASITPGLARTHLNLFFFNFL